MNSSPTSSIHTVSPSSARYAAIPEDTMSALTLYVNEGIRPGSFLQAILHNDLFGAHARADKENYNAISLIVSYIYNEIRGDCWGGPQIMREYIEQKRAEKEAQFGLEPKVE